MQYEVTVVAKVRVHGPDFEAAARLATGIIKGDTGKPDSATIKDVFSKSIEVL